MINYNLKSTNLLWKKRKIVKFPYKTTQRGITHELVQQPYELWKSIERFIQPSNEA